MTPSRPEAGPWLIGRFGALAGVKPDSVRFYERSGLLPKPQRTAAGYRLYDTAALKQLRFIRRAQALGFTLDEIRRILSLRGRGGERCRCVVAIAEATLSETEQRLAELGRFRDSLRKLVRAWKRDFNPADCAASEFCNLIENAPLDDVGKADQTRMGNGRVARARREVGRRRRGEVKTSAP